MVLELLLWHFLSSLVFIGVTSFSTSLPPSQQLPQPLTVEPLTSSSRFLGVPNLQPLSLRSPTPHRPLHVSLPPWILLQLRFCRYHWDRFAPIYTLVETSQPSEIARATQIFCAQSHALHPPPRADSLLHAPLRTCTHKICTCWHHCPPFADITCHVNWHQAVDPHWPYRWLTLIGPLTFYQSWLLQSRCFLPSFSRRFHFCSPFLHIFLLNEE